MDGVAGALKQQQTQTSNPGSQGRATQKVQQMQQSQAKKVDVAKQTQESATSQNTQSVKKISTEEQARELVSKLNDALAPMSTDLRFGFDNTDEVFYVSVIESSSNKMIRRFPAEQAADFLPKMQEVTGILFDSKG